MKRFLKISVIFLLYLVLCGKSCGDEEGKLVREEQQIVIARDSIRGEFEVDYLTEESRFAAEVAAMQKLQDLADYARIYSDLSIDSLFRQKAGEMINELFVSEKSSLTFGVKGKKARIPLTLHDFLYKCFGDEVRSAEVRFDSLRVLEPLQKAGKDLYKGRLGAVQVLTYYTVEDTIAPPTEEISVDIINQKVRKAFGNDTLTVWKVSLGDMRNRR